MFDVEICCGLIFCVLPFLKFKFVGCLRMGNKKHVALEHLIILQLFVLVKDYRRALYTLNINCTNCVAVTLLVVESKPYRSGKSLSYIKSCERRLV